MSLSLRQTHANMNQNQRFLSLDVFRGLTVAGMILVNNPGSWGYVYAPFRHAKWDGCTPTDLVFPFFLFAVGNAMSFAMKKYDALGNAAVLGKIFKRTLLIFLIGLFLNAFPFVKYNEAGDLVFKGFDKLRILGVLQRIALCYGIGALLIHYLRPKGALIAAIVLLFGYWEYTGTDYEADMRVLGEAAITKQWLALTDPCQAPLKTAAPGEWWSIIPEIYHLD